MCPSIFYDKKGRNITLEQWSELRKDEGYFRIAETILISDDEPLRVSTVWLGINHSFFGNIPIIFETMTFGHGEYADLQERYATEEAALAGHDRMVAQLMDAHHETEH